MAEIFTQWFDPFVKFTKPTQLAPVLLVLDGHYLHTRNIEMISKARENHVCLPPHSTHRMQYLNMGFMSSLKIYYAQEIEICLRNNPDRIVTLFIISRLFSAVYNRATIIELLVNAFGATGLFPLNRNIFQKHDFSIFEVEGRPPGNSFVQESLVK